MGRKEPNPMPKGLIKPPPPPAPPPCRTFLVETKEGKQKTRDWQNYIQGYGEGLKVGRHINRWGQK